jgi:hypothetical protein
MAEVVEPESRQPCFLRQSPPCRPPTIDMPGGVVLCNVISDYLCIVEFELRNKRGKLLVRRLYRAERFSPRPQPRQGERSHAGKGNHSLTRSRLRLANRDGALEEVNI